MTWRSRVPPPPARGSHENAPDQRAASSTHLIPSTHVFSLRFTSVIVVCTCQPDAQPPQSRTHAHFLLRMPHMHFPLLSTGKPWHSGCAKLIRLWPSASRQETFKICGLIRPLYIAVLPRLQGALEGGHGRAVLDAQQPRRLPQPVPGRVGDLPQELRNAAQGRWNMWDVLRTGLSTRVGGHHVARSSPEGGGGRVGGKGRGGVGWGRGC